MAGEAGVPSLGGAGGQGFECALPLSFDPLPPLIVGRQPLWVAAADLDSDGNVDLVSTSQPSPNVAVNFGEGGGAFETMSLFPTLGNAIHVGQGGVADLTGDGRLDIAAVSDTGVRVLVNRGARRFEPITLPLSEGAIALATADLSGDARLDLVVANSDDTILVLLNEGDTFGNPQPYLSGPGTRDVAAGDLDGDGDADLIVANGLDDTVSLLTNLGNGTFAAPVLHEVGYSPISLALVDLDGDGDRDVAAANFGTDDVSVLLNDGAGHLAPATTYPIAGGSPYSLAAADLTADGAPDLVVANAGGSTLGILINQEDGTFAPVIHYPIGPSHVSVTLADLNGDSSIDIAAADYNYGDGSVPMNGRLRVLLNECLP